MYIFHSASAASPLRVQMSLSSMVKFYSTNHLSNEACRVEIFQGAEIPFGLISHTPLQNSSNVKISHQSSKEMQTVINQNKEIWLLEIRLLILLSVRFLRFIIQFTIISSTSRY